MKDCVSDNSNFEYVKPAPLNQRLILLTKDGRYEIGAWKGEPLPHNRTYMGWAEIPARDKAFERQWAVA